jgi:hypothetical protein
MNWIEVAHNVAWLGQVVWWRLDQFKRSFDFQWIGQDSNLILSRLTMAPLFATSFPIATQTIASMRLCRPAAFPTRRRSVLRLLFHVRQSPPHSLTSDKQMNN